MFLVITGILVAEVAGYLEARAATMIPVMALKYE
jgi:hypothetical protein